MSYAFLWLFMAFFVGLSIIFLVCRPVASLIKDKQQLKNKKKQREKTERLEAKNED